MKKSEQMIQSVPSKKAEPIKLWLARVGYERMQEMVDPEKALNRNREYWQKQGRSTRRRMFRKLRQNKSKEARAIAKAS